MSFPVDSEVSSGPLKRFNKFVIDPGCLLEVEATYFCFDNNLSFSSNIFSCIEVRFKCFSKWFGITINTNFLKVKGFDLFIQICHQVSLSLKPDNVTRIFWAICLVLETWSCHYLFVKVLIKMGFLIPS